MKRRLVLLSAVLVATLPAQQTSGVIRGSLLDASGSVVPNAKVTARSLATGLQWETSSDALGNYSFPLLAPGSYSVTADASGFKKLVREPVLVRITEVAVVNFALEVGALTESVNVSETVPLVQTDTSSTGRVIEHDSIVAIPLATRNFTQLLGLTPGVSTEPFNAEQIGFGTVNPNVNGMRKGSNNYLLDGQVNNNPMNNALEGIGTPSVDFLQEFKVIANLYSAEYGRNAGSIVNVVTRGGTNELHGNLFEFFRNRVLNARPYFAQRRGQNQQNQFGASVGGPILIPRLYDGRNQSFFFVGYEGLRQRNTNSNAALVTGRVPTADERRGLFPSPITDPATGQPFPGNQVPAARVHPTSALLLERYVPPGNVADPRVNFIQQFGTPFDGNQITYRIDHVFSEKDRLMARHYTMWANRFAAQGRLPGFGNVQLFDMRQLTLNETHVFSPRLLNEFRFSYYNFPSSSTDQQRIDATSAGIRPLNPDRLGLPGILVTGFLSYGYTGNDWKDQISAFAWNDTFTLVRGRHTAKWGAEIRYGQEQSFGVPFQGRFNFNGQYTGQALADFLLAAPESVTVANGPGKIDMRDWNFNFFVQDDWKVTPRLTLNLGLRYEYNRPLTDSLLGRLLNFYPDRYRGPAVDSGLVIGGETPGVPAATVHPDKNNFAPRLGFAYALGSRSRTVIRGGIGIFYDTRTGQITQQKLFEPPYSAVSVRRYTRANPPAGYVFPPAIDLSRPTVTVPGGGAVDPSHRARHRDRLCRAVELWPPARAGLRARTGNRLRRHARPETFPFPQYQLSPHDRRPPATSL